MILSDTSSHLDVGRIARLLPGFSHHQISCALTRLVSKGLVAFEDDSSLNMGNNKRSRVYFIKRTK